MATWDLQQLFGQFANGLIRRASRRVGSADVASDIVQDAFLRLLHAPPAEAVANPKGYLFKIADNLAVDHIRRDNARARRHAGFDGAESVASDEVSAETALSHKQEAAQLAKIIGELPPKCRKVFLMHKFDGLTHQEIATRLGVSKSVVEKHVMKAIAHCRDRLDATLK